MGNKWTKTKKKKSKIIQIQVSETDIDYWMFCNLKTRFNILLLQIILYMSSDGRGSRPLFLERAEQMVPVKAP